MEIAARHLSFDIYRLSGADMGGSGTLVGLRFGFEVSHPCDGKSRKDGARKSRGVSRTALGFIQVNVAQG